MKIQRRIVRIKRRGRNRGRVTIRERIVRRKRGKRKGERFVEV